MRRWKPRPPLGHHRVRSMFSTCYVMENMSVNGKQFCVDHILLSGRYFRCYIEYEELGRCSPAIRTLYVHLIVHMFTSVGKLKSCEVSRKDILSEYPLAEQDTGGIVQLEHVFLNVPDRVIAEHFYCDGMGFLLDAFMPRDLHMKGRQQLHVNVTDRATVMEGRFGIVMKNVTALRRRLSEVQSLLSETKFTYRAVDNYTVDVTCPWGNQFRVHAHRPGEEASIEHPNFPTGLGLAYLELRCPPHTAADIARFYKQRMGAITQDATLRMGGARAVDIIVGARQRLTFVEDETASGECGDWHIGIYVANFSELFRSLSADTLIFKDVEERQVCRSVEEALGDYQLRFRNIMGGTVGDENSKRVVFQMQHEVRSLFHESFARELANRIE